MIHGQEEEAFSASEKYRIIFGSTIIPLARMIYSGKIDPETITFDQFKDKLFSLGKTNENAFELYADGIDKKMRLVEHCVAEDHPQSGVVLLFTLIEGEVNAVLRIRMRIRGFSPAVITDSLKGTDFNTKLDVLLRLLDVEVPERFRNNALQCKSIRNFVVHNKATPNLFMDGDDKLSDTKIADERATHFFVDNPIDRLQTDLEEFCFNAINNEPSVQWGQYLFEKYFRYDGDGED